ncbi:trimeric intracellular cation channel family protein [Flavobacteriaceae bacterium F89]|uniref:Trimeric intracellular cation channel family protein n=1 Tax=Cerina litoralis TaxID=2874477 RepID=A0AAE3ERI4_9FLAO|nr:trimeric intracellular cation channel family protein [Cerina litoralis]MCG2459593.1 trimeric intracellular cation channel family protein [Cerina litoralis]
MFYFILDILGTIAFAISGVMVAMDKKLDVFGVFIVAFVTAVGGGTLRDVLIGQTPLFWLKDLTYIVTIIGAVIVAVVFRSRMSYFKRSLLLFDTLGIGLYTLVGVEKGLAVGLSPIMCVALGTITACFGGVTRDILCNEIPVIFRREIYATACILGGFGFFILRQLPLEETYSYATAILIIIVIRLLAVKFKLALPNIYKST